LYGYFSTSDVGGFSDVISTDELNEDSYKIYFGPDNNNDNYFDVGAPTTYANITIPCPTVQQQVPTQQPPSTQQTPSQHKGVNWGAVCRSLDSFISEPCETLTSSNGYVLTQEGKRVVACFLGGALLLMADKVVPGALQAAKELVPQVNCG
jgi:hypothetical protein